MSFSFSAVGTRDEVVAQLKRANSYNNHVGELMRHALIEAVSSEAEYHGSHDCKYIVEASGHQDLHNAGLSLNVSVRMLYILKSTPETETDKEH